MYLYALARNTNISVTHKHTHSYMRYTAVHTQSPKMCANGGGKYSSDSCNCDRRTSIMYII